MFWRYFLNGLAITSRRRRLASAVVCGFSLAVRFTSAAGEEVEIPAPSVQQAKRVMTGAGRRLPYEDWAQNAAQPIVFRLGWPLGSANCRAGM